jgi:tetratricopeptide (TPR) repeat protein
MRRSAGAGLLVLSVAFATSGCGQVQEFRKGRHLKAAERYVSEKKYKEAAIEYRNALRLDPNDLETLKKLGIALYDGGQLGAAFPALKRFHDQSPADSEAGLRLGTIYLMGRAPDKAREIASAALEKEPRNLQALLLLAEAADSPELIEDAIRRLEENRAALGEPDRVSRALGVLYARKRDVPKAEEAFKAAVSSKPDSPEAHLALARLHLGKRELEAAEKEFKAAAELAPPGSFARLQLADFYLLTRRVDDAKRELQTITSEAPDAFPAWLRLAEMAFAEQRYDDAQQALDPVLKANPEDATGLLIQTRIYLAKRETDKAVEIATRLASKNPAMALAHHTLAMAQLQAGNPALALSAAKDAVARAPLYTDAVLLAAELEMQSGDTLAAINGLKSYTQQQHRDPRGWEALGLAYLRTKDPAMAIQAFARAGEAAPNSPRVPYLTGLALRVQGKKTEARREFERALAMAPRFVDPLTQLASMSFADNRPEEAISRIQRQAMLEPKAGEIQYLLGRAYQATKDTAQAEAALRKAAELNPNLSAAYVSLGQLYGISKEYDRSIEQLDKVLATNPEQPAALMMWSVAQQMKGEKAKAKDGYERLLKTNPRFAPAANNLAWMLAESGEDLPRALLLAQSARDAAPEDPQIADTFGWILYKQGAYPRAAAILKEAAEKLPDNPEVLYHLGLALAKIGDDDGARKALTQALAASDSFTGVAEARATLASLPPAR